MSIGYIFPILELAVDLQAQMCVDGTAALRAQLQDLKNENSELMKTAYANDGLKRVKVRLEQAESEMVSADSKWIALF